MDNMPEFHSFRIGQKRRLLEQVDEAISAILNGAQSYTIGTRTLTRANLKDLMEYQKQLESEVGAEENDAFLLGDTSVAYFDRR